MVWYVTLKDITAFFKKEKVVFIWLILSMVVCSFVLNYSYSFARYRGVIYDHATGADIPVYQISGSDRVRCSKLDDILSEFDDAGLPKVVSVACYTTTENGLRIAGATELSTDVMQLGLWVEGYALPISKDEIEACVVEESLLSYDGRMKMTGETFRLDEEDYVIRGVFEAFMAEADVVIFMDTYKEKYGYFDDVRITFQDELGKKEQQEFESIVKKYIEHGSISYPEMSSDGGAMVTGSNQTQYSIFIVLLVVFLASVIQYWYDVNISAYTVYWLTGASNKQILKVVCCEILLLCSSTYMIGLILNAISRLIFTRNAPLTIGDVAMGFGIFFGTMLIFSLINMFRICQTFSVNNIRRD